MKFSVINTCSALLLALLRGEGYGLQLEHPWHFAHATTHRE